MKSVLSFPQVCAFLKERNPALAQYAATLVDEKVKPPSQTLESGRSAPALRVPNNPSPPLITARPATRSPPVPAYPRARTLLLHRYAV
jgi:hypothetical protein